MKNHITARHHKPRGGRSMMIRNNQGTTARRDAQGRDRATICEAAVPTATVDGVQLTRTLFDLGSDVDLWLPPCSDIDKTLAPDLVGSGAATGISGETTLIGEPAVSQMAIDGYVFRLAGRQAAPRANMPHQIVSNYTTMMIGVDVVSLSSATIHRTGRNTPLPTAHLLPYVLQDLEQQRRSGATELYVHYLDHTGMRRTGHACTFTQ